MAKKSGGRDGRLRMLRRAVLAGGALFVTSLLQAQDGDVLYPGPGLTQPTLVRKTEPTYTEQARHSGLQGKVLMAVTIDESGVPLNPLILSSLGQGLDEQAVRCVLQWRFQPAVKDRRPVKIRVLIEVYFHLAGRTFNVREEDLRKTSDAVRMLMAHATPDGNPGADNVKLMQSLARHGRAAAEYVVGLWELQGGVLPKDEADGLNQIQAAAKQDHPAALLFLGIANMDGKLMTRDTKKGLAFLQKAAKLGSAEAQFELGRRYRDGDGVEMDEHVAEKYFRSCAGLGKVECQSSLR